MNGINFIPLTTIDGDTILIQSVELVKKNLSEFVSQEPNSEANFSYELYVTDISARQRRIAFDLHQEVKTILGLRELITLRLRKLARGQSEPIDLRDHYEHQQCANHLIQKCGLRVK